MWWTDTVASEIIIICRSINTRCLKNSPLFHLPSLIGDSGKTARVQIKRIRAFRWRNWRTSVFHLGLFRVATVKWAAGDTGYVKTAAAACIAKCQTPLHGHRQLQTCCTTPPTDELTTILLLVVQQIHHIAMPDSGHVNIWTCRDVGLRSGSQSPTSGHVQMLRCVKFLSVGGEYVVQQVVELLWARTLMVLYNMSVAGVRVVEFGTNTFSSYIATVLELVHSYESVPKKPEFISFRHAWARRSLSYFATKHAMPAFLNFRCYHWLNDSADCNDRSHQL